MIPEAYKNKVGQTGQPKPEPDFLYFVQPSVTLFSTKHGFIGRTYTGRKVQLDDSSLRVLEQDWALIHTRITDPDVKAIVEYVLIVKQVRK